MNSRKVARPVNKASRSDRPVRSENGNEPVLIDDGIDHIIPIVFNPRNGQMVAAAFGLERFRHNVNLVTFGVYVPLVVVVVVVIVQLDHTAFALIEQIVVYPLGDKLGPKRQKKKTKKGSRAYQRFCLWFASDPFFLDEDEV